MKHSREGRVREEGCQPWIKAELGYTSKIEIIETGSWALDDGWGPVGCLVIAWGEVDVEVALQKPTASLLRGLDENMHMQKKEGDMAGWAC